MTVPRTDHVNDTEQWLSVHDACSLLGVSPATLRRWSAAGEVQAFTTPGGHRRYARSTILGLLPDAGRARPSLAELGVTPERMARVLRRRLAPTVGGPEWLAGLDDAALADLRGLGRRIVAALIAAVDAAGPASWERALADGCAAASGYGRAASAAGGQPVDIVRTHLAMRTLVVEELAHVARRHGFDTGESTRLVLDALRAADRLLPALLDGLGAGAVLG